MDAFRAYPPRAVVVETVVADPLAAGRPVRVGWQLRWIAILALVVIYVNPICASWTGRSREPRHARGVTRLADGHAADERVARVHVARLAAQAAVCDVVGGRLVVHTTCSTKC